MSDQKTIQNRIEKNFRHRAKWARKEGLDCFRVYEKDIPEFPFIVDVYRDYAVIFEKRDSDIDAEKFDHFNFIISAVKNVMNLPEEKIVIKSRMKQKGSTQYEKLEERNEYIPVKEYQAEFLVNLHDYLDTGLFLDHRPMRQLIFKEAKDKKFLNLFSYTGSVSVMAALGGACHVTSVDLSSTYQEWARKNFEHNKLSLKNHNFIVQSALDYLEQSVNKFDLIFLDPPTFSNSKKMEEDFEVERDQAFIIKHCLRLLNPGGTLYFSNNKRKFKLDPALSEFADVVDITEKSIPPDYRDRKIHHCFKITAKKYE
ncbi:MAG: class I SAM-dependent methyltransferase [Bacteriovorax sp.]|jgi:23S rRNA (cytosine1962-C5)-methyltransferase/23S rRNA (guanine2445-N2)-methyltransferase / 23S rRNA (guanine2069-N7)-methyltransferase